MPALAAISFIFSYSQEQTPTTWYTKNNTSYITENKTLWMSKRNTQFSTNNRTSWYVKNNTEWKE